MIKQRTPSATSGFTLIEMSIVLGVIGLILSVIFISGEVVQQAALRKQMTQINSIQSGIQNFRVKYNCYPGDCVDPTIIKGYVYVGNGDGFLPQTWNGDENKGFWAHLNVSKMIGDALVTSNVQTVGDIITPRMASNKTGVINAYGSLTYGQNILEFDTTLVAGAFKTQDVANIDAKLDDGIAATGSVRTTGYGAGTDTVYAAIPSFPLATGNNYGSTQCLVAGAYSGAAALGECNMVYLLGNN